MNTDKLATMKKKTFLQRLVRCTIGEGNLTVGLVVTGLMITAAAVAGANTKKGVDDASSKISNRTNYGAAGNAPTPK